MIAGLALLAWIYLLVWHGRFWQSGPFLSPARPLQAPPVAVVVPARDEAGVIGRSIASLLAQNYPGELRVVLVDDNSSDATAAIARALPGAERLTVIEGAPRPPGWAGKLWAVHQGVSAAKGELLLLTDADIEHDPAHVSTLVAQAERSGVDLVSEMVALNCRSLAERALVPAFVYLFQLLYPFAWVNDELRATAAAAGGTVLIRRRALDRIGGIEAIRGALIDDCALAARVKMGGRIWLGHSRLARSIRPYPSVADIWRMVARSAYVQLRFSPLLLLGTTLGLALIFLAPPLFAIFGDGWPRWTGTFAWLGMAASFIPTLAQFGRAPAWAPLLPAIAAFYMAATIGAAIDHHRGRGVVWKSRAYKERQA
ncbi:MAG TPA: glycosyltransferase [Acetobacteraceae bacterium]